LTLKLKYVNIYTDKIKDNKEKIMKIRVKEIQKFKAEINGMEFDDETVFNTVRFILENVLSETFNISEVKHCFLKDFAEAVKDAWESHKELCGILDFDIELRRCIENADSFEKIEFETFGNLEDFKELNEKIKKGYYSK
jgi:hypothetical protein